jgi:hypothetical protein
MISVTMCRGTIWKIDGLRIRLFRPDRCEQAAETIPRGAHAALRVEKTGGDDLRRKLERTFLIG